MIKSETKSADILVFPCLLVSNHGLIILAIEATSSSFTGICVGKTPDHNVSSDRTGEYSKAWAKECFTDFHGSVTLSS